MFKNITNLSCRYLSSHFKHFNAKSLFRPVVIQQRSFSDTEPTKVEYFSGYDLVCRRTSIIIQNITERQPTKLLDLDSDGCIFPHMRNANYLAVSGYAATASKAEECTKSGFYVCLDTHDESSETKEEFELPYEARSFGLVTWLQPMDSPPLNIPMRELSRILNDAGTLVIGGLRKDWEERNVFDALYQLEQTQPVQIMIMQEVDIKGRPMNDQLEYLNEGEEGGEDRQDGNGHNSEKQEMYVICVLQNSNK